MSDNLANVLDLTTAWKRIKDDVRHRVFLRHPYSISLIESDLEGWLLNVRELIQTGRYEPRSMFVCDVPKGKSLVRPGSHLSHTDRLIYAACVGACLPAIHNTLKWSQGTVDFSYRLSRTLNNPDWLRDRFTGWQDFREQSIRRIDKGALYVVMADISAFYENIDISILISDLKQAEAEPQAVEQIGKCLNKWAQVPGRGVPQGQSASDILAKLYLNNIDLNLRHIGYDHFRYVDDIRIFCDDLVDAKKVLVELARLLRKRGLSLQAAKSEIYRADQAREQIEDVATVLKSVRDRFINEVVRETGLGDPYMSVPEADKILENSPEEAPIEVIEDAYQTFFVDSAENFNATLFRFLLNRLAKQENSFAAEHSLTLLESHPEETQAILDYHARIESSPDDELIEFLKSDRSVYDYQNYQILEFYLNTYDSIPEDVLSIARGIAFDPNRPRYLRTVCRALVGKYGHSADLERLLNSYDEITDPSEKVEVICSIYRVEKGRRNSFLGRAERDGEMNRRAARWIRSLENGPYIGRA